MAKQTRQVSIFINGKEVENSIKAIAAEQKKLNNELAGMNRGLEGYETKAAELAKVNTILREHRQAVSGIKQGWDLTKLGVSNFIGVAAGAFAVDSLLGYGKQLYGVGVQMDALDKKAKTVFGATLPQVSAEAEKNARAMGLTTSQYINAAAAIQDILIPMGFQRKEAADISTQLTNLSGALSEWTGGQVSATQVSEILSSALTGEREQLKQLGIVLQQEDINARLAEKGLDKLTGTMRQQAEAAATLELILEKSTDAQAGFANGADSAIRRQAELSAKISEIVEKLATLLLPVFEKLADIAGGVVGAVGEVVGVIDDLVNPAEAATKAFDQQAATVSDLENNISPLLDRYDELAGKTTLNAAEQDELQKIITEVSGVIPTAISGFDAYGRALGLNTDKAREFIEVERARLKFINQEAIAENEKFIAETQRQADIVLEKLRSGRAAVTRPSTTGFGAVTEFADLSGSDIQKLQAEAAKLQETLKGANAEVARLKGDTLEAPIIPPPDAPDTGGGGGGGKDAKKEAERLAKDLEDLIRRTSETRLDLISKAQDDELAATIRGIEKRYDAEIAKALELEKKGVTEATAQRIALEKLKQEEIGLAVEADIEKAIAEASETAKEIEEARIKARKEVEDKDIEERAEALEEIKAFTQENLLTEQEQELAQLEEHYNTLLDLAKKNGFDIVALTEAYNKAKNEVLAKYNTEEQQLLDAQIELQKAKLQAFGDAANALSGFFEESSAMGKALFLFQKAAAAAEVLINLQIETAKINATYASIPFAGPAIAATLTTAARIRAGISLATIAATAIKGVVKQKKEGRYLTVTGEDDGRTYNASVIPTPHTGLLPPHPVLFQSQATGQPVLASERGAEYFVSSESLRNPYVANLTRMIDNIATSGGGRGVAQFADGGATAPLDGRRVENSGSSTNRETMRLIEQNTAVMQALLTAVQRGIIAVVPDGTVLDIQERFEKINNGSGGYYG